MGISVDGYGNITQGNAKEIYTAWKSGEVELNKSQQAKCESFLSPNDIDDIEYDDKVTEKRGKESIDTKNAQDNGNGTETGATAAATVASGASITAVFACIATGKELSNTNGFFALYAAIAAVASSAIAMTMSFLFDNQLDDRKQHAENADTNNQTMDTYNESLAATMDMMNEDVQLYKEQQDILTQTVNTQASEGADLQMQIDTAAAMGDKEQVQALKQQMQALKETDNSALVSDLEETGGAIDEYRSMNLESLSCAESGQTVSDFLKEGKTKGILAMVNGGLCAAGAIMAGIAIATSAVPKIWVPVPVGLFVVVMVPIDLISGTMASVMWGTTAAMLGTASGMFFKKGSNELECGSKGDEMQEHIDNLNDMISQQDVYATDTESLFTESDETAEKSKEATAEAAGNAVITNTKTFNSSNNPFANYSGNSGTNNPTGTNSNA